MVATKHIRSSPAALRVGSWSLAGHGENQAIDGLLRHASSLGLRAPELTVVFGERAAALAEAAGLDKLWVRAEGLVVSGRVRLGLRAETAGRAVAALRSAEDLGETALAAGLRTDIAVCARSAGVPLTGLAALRPALGVAGFTGAAKAAALCHLVGCVSQFGRKPELDRTLAEADRLCGADDDLDGDERLLGRALVRVAMSAHRRRHADVMGAADAARTGLGLLEQLDDPSGDGGVVRVRLVLQLLCSLLDRGDAENATEVAESVLAESPRAAAIAPLGWLRMALATRVLLPAGSVNAAAVMLRDAVHSTERHGLHALTSRLWGELAYVEERLGRSSESIECLHQSRAAEHLHTRSRRQAMGLLAGAFGDGSQAALDLDDVLGATAQAAAGDAPVFAAETVAAQAVSAGRNGKSDSHRSAQRHTQPASVRDEPAVARTEIIPRVADPREERRPVNGNHRAAEKPAPAQARPADTATPTELSTAGPESTTSRREPPALPSERSEQPAMPSERTTSRSEQPTLPSERTTSRSEQSTLPSARTALPTDLAAELAERTTSPSAVSAEHAAVPGERTAASTERSAPPAEQAAAPTDGTAPPAGLPERTTVPIERVATSTEATTAPSDRTTAVPDIPLAPPPADEPAPRASLAREPKPSANAEAPEKDEARPKTRHAAAHGTVAARSVLDRLGISPGSSSGGRRRAADDSGEPARAAATPDPTGGVTRGDDVESAPSAEAASSTPTSSEDSVLPQRGAEPSLPKRDSGQATESRHRAQADSAPSDETAPVHAQPETARSGESDVSARADPATQPGASSPDTAKPGTAKPNEDGAAPVAAPPSNQDTAATSASRQDKADAAREADETEPEAVRHATAQPAENPFVVKDPWLPRLKLPPSLEPFDDVSDETPVASGTHFTSKPVIDDDSLGEPFRREYLPPDDDLPADAGLADLLARALAEHQAGTSSAAALVKRLGNQNGDDRSTVNGHGHNGEPPANGRHRGDH